MKKHSTKRPRKVFSYKVNECEVCGFPFSQLHHVYPQEFGGENSKLIRLCPNHHHLVHMIYTMIESKWTDEAIETFKTYCDVKFRDKWFAYFFDTYQSARDGHKIAILDSVLTALMDDYRIIRDPESKFTFDTDKASGRWYAVNKAGKKFRLYDPIMKAHGAVDAYVIRYGVKLGWLGYGEIATSHMTEVWIAQAGIDHLREVGKFRGFGPNDESSKYPPKE